MTKLIATVAAAGALLVTTASAASAHGPTCQGGTWENHGEHITEDYVAGDGAGGGAPAHFGSGYQPGASFCLDKAQSKPVDPPAGRS